MIKKRQHSLKKLLYIILVGLITPSILATTFSTQELEALGLSTIEESLNFLTTQHSQNDHSTPTQIVYEGQELSIEDPAFAQLKTLSLKHIDSIELSKDGTKIKYHLSKTLNKDGITALYSFTILEDTSSQEPTVTTPTNFPTKTTTLGNKVTILTQKELNVLGIKSIEEALSLIGNVSISNASSIKSLFMRGFHSGATKVLYNGIDLKDTIGINGAPLFELISIEDIDRIEILSGSNSTINGSGALAGVINIVSKNDSANGYVTTTLANNQHNTTIKTSTTLKNNQLSLIANQVSNNNLSAKSNDSEIDKQSKQTIHINFKNNTLLGGQFSSTLSLIDNQQDLDDTFSDDVTFDADLLSLNYQKSFLNHITNIQFDLANIERNFTSSSWGNSFYKGTTATLGLNNKLTIHNNKQLVFGINYNKETGENTYFSSQSQESTGLYSQLNWTSPILSSQIGGRAEYQSYNQRITQTYNTSVFKDIFGIRTTATLKTGYRIPTLYEQSVIADNTTTLNPETSYTKELSFSKTLNKYQFKTTLFDSNINNKIDFNDSYQTTNINTSTQKGHEHILTIKKLHFIDFLTISYTSLTSKNDGETALKIPKNKLTMTAGMSHKKWNYGLAYIYESDKQDYADTTIASYDIANFNVNYQLENQLSFHLKLHNIFNETYETAAGFNELKRTMYFGVKKTF